MFILDLFVLHTWSLFNGHMPEYLSHYGRRQEGWLWTKGLIFMAAGVLGFALALPAALHKSPWVTASLGLCAIIFVGVAIVAGFKTNVSGEETTTQGQIHMAAVIPTFLAITLAMIVMGFAFYQDPRWNGLANTSWGLAGLSALSIAAFAESRYNGILEVSITERLIVLFALMWFVIVAKHLTKVIGEVRRQTLEASQPDVLVLEA